MARSLTVCIAFLGAGLATPGLGQGVSENGAELYGRHCAACHGAAGQGDGPMSVLLAIPVPDLTSLAARAGGELSVARTVSIIEGDAVLRGHGSAMPVFGPIVTGPSVALDAADGSPVQTTQSVADLVAFLNTLQR